MALEDTFIDEEEDTCPLCIEEFDLSDRNFRPCPCGYQVCQFCFNNIKNNMNGLCPACRRPYDEKTIQYKVVTADEIAEFRANIQKNQKKRAQEQRQKEVQKREAEKENRKSLVGVRVVQKNLVYVTGLTPTIREDELLKTLRKHEFFGQYGTIQKISISNRRSTDGQNQSLGIYVAFEKPDEASRCISAVNGSQNGDRILKAQLGTTKYCSAWLRHESCNNRQCMFLHELGDEEDSYTRQDLSSMNSIHTQRPLPGASGSSASGSASASRPSAGRPPPPAISQAMARSGSKDSSTEAGAGPDGSALPSSASWARPPPPVRSRRGSLATSGAAPSPAVSTSLPATAGAAQEATTTATAATGTAAADEESVPQPQLQSQHPLPPLLPSAKRNARSAATQPSSALAPAPPQPAPPPAPAPAPAPASASKLAPRRPKKPKGDSDSADRSLRFILRAFRDCPYKVPKYDQALLDQYPPLFDIHGGEKRRAMREEEEPHLSSSPSSLPSPSSPPAAAAAADAAGAAAVAADQKERPNGQEHHSEGEPEAATGGSHALGGEPEDREPPRGAGGAGAGAGAVAGAGAGGAGGAGGVAGTDGHVHGLGHGHGHSHGFDIRRPVTQPPIQRGMGGSAADLFGPSLHSAGSTGFGAPIGSRTVTPQQMLMSRASTGPAHGFADQLPPGLSAGAHMFQSQQPQHQMPQHQHQQGQQQQVHGRQASRFGFAGPDGGAPGKLPANLRAMAAASQYGNISSPFSPQGMSAFHPAPPPGLKPTGTPPAAMFGPAGFNMAGPGFGTPKDNSELLQTLIRGRGPGAGQAATHDAAAKHLSDPSILQVRMQQQQQQSHQAQQQPQQQGGGGGAGASALFGSQGQQDDQDLSEYAHAVSVLVEEDGPAPPAGSTTPLPASAAAARPFTPAAASAYGPSSTLTPAGFVSPSAGFPFLVPMGPMAMNTANVPVAPPALASMPSYFRAPMPTTTPIPAAPSAYGAVGRPSIATAPGPASLPIPTPPAALPAITSIAPPAPAVQQQQPQPAQPQAQPQAQQQEPIATPPKKPEPSFPSSSRPTAVVSETSKRAAATAAATPTAGVEANRRAAAAAAAAAAAEVAATALKTFAEDFPALDSIKAGSGSRSGPATPRIAGPVIMATSAIAKNSSNIGTIGNSGSSGNNGAAAAGGSSSSSKDNVNARVTRTKQAIATATAVVSEPAASSSSPLSARAENVMTVDRAAFPPLPVPTPTSSTFLPARPTVPSAAAAALKTIRLVGTSKIDSPVITSLPPKPPPSVNFPPFPSSAAPGSDEAQTRAPTVSDSTSVSVSASVSAAASRASSPPPQPPPAPSQPPVPSMPTSIVGTAAVRSTTKSQQRKQRKEAIREKAAQTEGAIVTKTIPIPEEKGPEEAADGPKEEHAPVLGRRRKQKKDSVKAGSVPSSPTTTTTATASLDPAVPPQSAASKKDVVKEPTTTQETRKRKKRTEHDDGRAAAAATAASAMALASATAAAAPHHGGKKDATGEKQDKMDKGKAVEEQKNNAARRDQRQASSAGAPNASAALAPVVVIIGPPDRARLPDEDEVKSAGQWPGHEQDQDQDEELPREARAEHGQMARIFAAVGISDPTRQLPFLRSVTGFSHLPAGSAGARTALSADMVFRPPSPTATCRVVSEADRAELLVGRPVRKMVDGQRVLLTPNGDCVRNLTRAEEDRFLELQEALGAAAGTPAVFVSPRHSEACPGGFTLLRGRAVPNGPPSCVPGGWWGEAAVDPASKIHREEAIAYINQVVMPRLTIGSGASGAGGLLSSSSSSVYQTLEPASTAALTKLASPAVVRIFSGVGNLASGSPGPSDSTGSASDGLVCECVEGVGSVGDVGAREGTGPIGAAAAAAANAANAEITRAVGATLSVNPASPSASVSAVSAANGTPMLLGMDTSTLGTTATPSLVDDDEEEEEDNEDEVDDGWSEPPSPSIPPAPPSSPSPHGRAETMLEQMSTLLQGVVSEIGGVGGGRNSGGGAGVSLGIGGANGHGLAAGGLSGTELAARLPALSGPEEMEAALAGARRESEKFERGLNAFVSKSRGAVRSWGVGGTGRMGFD